MEIAGLENAGNDIVWKTTYYLCLLQSTKYGSHHVLFVGAVATVACYHFFAFRLVSYVQKMEYATIPTGRGFVYAHANQTYERVCIAGVVIRIVFLVYTLRFAFLFRF